MKTKIKTVHEETDKSSEQTKVIGVLFCTSLEDNWKDSLIYVYKNNTYTFFETIDDMINYLFGGGQKMKRAYMPESEFDAYYDAEYIEGKFTEKLKWF